jgi:hypothetical protein
MNWTCEQTDEQLSDYLDGILSPEESAAFVEHARTCSYCDVLAKRVLGALQMMRAAAPPEPPAHLAGKIISATLGPQRAPAESLVQPPPQSASQSPSQTWWQRWLGSEGFVWQPQFAMGAVTVAASFFIVMHASAKSQNASGFAALNPAIVFRQADRQVHLAYAHTAKFVNDQRLVYEIESRLEPQAEPAVFAPPQQQSAPQPGGQPRSEQKSRPDNTTAQARNLYAAVVPAEPISASTITRSML